MEDEKKEVNLNNLLKKVLKELGLSKSDEQNLCKYNELICSDFGKTIEHYLSISNCVKQIDSFKIYIPKDHRFRYWLKKFDLDASYRVTLFKVNYLVNTDNIYQYFKTENKYMFGGKEGLSLLIDICPEKIPQGKWIHSFKRTRGTDIPNIYLHKHEIDVILKKDFEHFAHLDKFKKINKDAIFVVFEKVNS